MSAARDGAQNWARGLYRLRQSWLSMLGLLIVAIMLLLAVAGPAIAPFPDDIAGAVHTGDSFRPPSGAHWFGTNEVGQDMLSLVLAGARVSLLSGVGIVVLAAIMGTIIGAIAGYCGGWIDEVLMRFTDLMLTVPSLILAMAVAAALGPGIGNMVLAISLTWWPGFARLVRGEVIPRKSEVYVLAARALGAGSGRILFRHILPNITAAIVVKMSLDVGFAILTVASLGFIGIGVKPPTSEWGSLLSVARGNMPDDWWTAIFPGMAIFIAVLGVNLLGDGLRDMLDPKARR